MKEHQREYFVREAQEKIPKMPGLTSISDFS
jgi:hypothetical protein